MRFAKVTVSLFSAAIFVALSTGAQAQDWPQWRGRNRDDKAAGFTAPKTWPRKFHQKWRVTVGQADGTPSLAGGKLYVFTRQASDEVTQCLDAATGKELWNNKYEIMAINGPAARQHPGPRSSPTVAEGKVITLSVRGVLSCLNAADGKVVWRRNVIKGWPPFFTAMSPMVVNGLCIAQLGYGTNGAIVAYDLATAVEKWSWNGDGPAYASPVLMSIGGAKLIVTQTEKHIVAVNLADGKLAWEAPFAPKGMTHNDVTPVIDGQTIFYTGGGRGTIAVALEKKGDGFAANQLWANTNVSSMYCTPVLKDGLLFGLSERAGFFCINAKTGDTAWMDPAKRGGFGSVIDIGSQLVALTPKSQLIVFQPTDKAYMEIASIKVADTDTYSQPVLSAAGIYVEDQNSVTLWSVD